MAMASYSRVIFVITSYSIHYTKLYDFEEICATLAATRPTAVNLFWALDRMKSFAWASQTYPVADIKITLEYEAMAIADEDLRRNLAIGRNGEPLIPENARVLTHCNAGALATGGYGTALGVLRARNNFV